MLDIALQEELAAFIFTWGAQRDDSECPRTEPLGHAPDKSALARCVSPFADDNHARSRFSHPVLQIAKFDLKLPKLLLVILARELLGGSSEGMGATFLLLPVSV